MITRSVVNTFDQTHTIKVLAEQVLQSTECLGCWDQIPPCGVRTCAPFLSLCGPSTLSQKAGAGITDEDLDPSVWHDSPCRIPSESLSQRGRNGLEFTRFDTWMVIVTWMKRVARPVLGHSDTTAQRMIGKTIQHVFFPTRARSCR